MRIQKSSLQRAAASVHSAHQYNWTNSRTELQILQGGREDPRVPWSWPVAAKSIAPARILIVDDVRSTVPLEHLLHGLGYGTTRIAASGVAALELAREFSPTVVLISLDLPDMDACDVAQRLREHSDVRHLRLIALTCDFAHAGREQAREAGFERYLAKPVNVSDLQRLLRGNPP